jgi:hypothetical protein
MPKYNVYQIKDNGNMIFFYESATVIILQRIVATADIFQNLHAASIQVTFSRRDPYLG